MDRMLVATDRSAPFVAGACPGHPTWPASTAAALTVVNIIDEEFARGRRARAGGRGESGLAHRWRGWTRTAAVTHSLVVRRVRSRGSDAIADEVRPISVILGMHASPPLPGI
jgi:hypothetical protein